MRFFAMIAAIAVAAGCAVPPKDLQGGPFSTMKPRDAVATPRAGEQVRWGGIIAAVEPMQGETCFEIVSQPLDSRARPSSRDITDGRFRACAEGFYDPAIYEPGRRVTVAGALSGTGTTKVEQFDLDVPVVKADVVHLWKPRRAFAAYPYGYAGFYGPYGAFPPFRGWWGVGYPYYSFGVGAWFPPGGYIGRGYVGRGFRGGKHHFRSRGRAGGSRGSAGGRKAVGRKL